MFRVKVIKNHIPAVSWYRHRYLEIDAVVRASSLSAPESDIRGIFTGNTHG